MKALQLVQYGNITDSLIFAEVSQPDVRSNDVLIEVKAAAINPIDKHIVLGNLQSMLPVPIPGKIAYDVSGMVVAAGDEVTDFVVGDLVYARVPQEQMGTIAEYVAVQDTDLTGGIPRGRLIGSSIDFLYWDSFVTALELL